MKHEHGHDHPFQPDLEDTPLTYHMAMTDALAAILLEKGVFAADEMRAVLERIDQAAPALGARLVARAWLDPEFKKRLIANTPSAARELNIDTGAIPVRTVADTPDLHNIIVCTLCSCYPRYLLGSSPDWYKARAYRSRVVKEPRRVLAEFGLELDSAVKIAVHDSTAELRYMVLPTRPQGTDGWSEDQLTAIITRDCMIGTSLPRARPSLGMDQD